jgi:hypothetical protein
MMERDSLKVLLGHIMTLVSWAVIILAWLFGTEGPKALQDVVLNYDRPIAGKFTKPGATGDPMPGRLAQSLSPVIETEPR